MKKQCPHCYKEASLEDFLLKHTTCSISSVKIKEHKKILNNKTLVKELPMSMVQMTFWESNKYEILEEIDKINEELEEKNIPLFVIENICLSNNEKDGCLRWHFYICNRETAIDSIKLSNGKIYEFTYPEQYPVNEGYRDIIQGIILKNEILKQIARSDCNFKYYYIDFSNILTEQEYKNNRIEFRKYVDNQRYLIKDNIKMSWLAKIKYFIIDTLLRITL